MTIVYYSIVRNIYHGVSPTIDALPWRSLKKMGRFFGHPPLWETSINGPSFGHRTFPLWQRVDIEWVPQGLAADVEVAA